MAWPSCWDIAAAYMRAKLSVGPPVGKATTKPNGLAGQTCASSGVSIFSRAVAVAAIKKDLFCMLVFSLGFMVCAPAC